MPIMLCKLNAVPDDEADDIRTRLSENKISFYETSAGNWGISMAAIWLHDETQFDCAKAIIDEYQQARNVQAQEEYKRLNQDGKSPKFIGRFRQTPVQMVLYLLAILAVIYFSTIPFFNLREWLG